MACPVCFEAGCPDCESGYITIDRCPLDVIDRDAIDAVRFSDLFERGLPPVAGGALDQTVQFLAIAEFVENETRYYKRKTGGGLCPGMM